MKDFIEKLNEMDIPSLENDPGESVVKQALMFKTFDETRKYKQKFRVVASVASVMSILFVLMIFKPQIASDMHQYAFGNSSIKELPIDIPENIMDDNLYYTSINNPQVSESVIPSNYKEEKAFIIRRYSSPDEGTMTLVSEFNEKPENDEFINGSL